MRSRVVAGLPTRSPGSTSKFIRTGCLANRPLRDRRISTETVRRISRAGRLAGLALLREDYALVDHEIREAVEYEADVDDALAAGAA